MLTEQSIRDRMVKIAQAFDDAMATHVGQPPVQDWDAWNAWNTCGSHAYAERGPIRADAISEDESRRALAALADAATGGELSALREQVTALQTRCTALLEERRAVDWTSQLRSMFVAFEQTLPARPTWPDAATVRMRRKLLREEVQETLDALDAHDMVEVADGCVDVVVVTLGMLLAFGIDPRPIWDEVMRTNFAKVEGGIQRSADGKVLKPAGWVAPDVHALLVAQGWQPPKEAA